MIDQITVFLENKRGRIASLCRTLGDANINMAALSVADTTEYGIVRIICSDTAAALAALDAGGYRAIKTKVMAIAVPHHPGGAADLLEKLDDLDVDIEYFYCFSTAPRRRAGPSRRPASTSSSRARSSRGSRRGRRLFSPGGCHTSDVWQPPLICIFPLVSLAVSWDEKNSRPGRCPHDSWSWRS